MIAQVETLRRVGADAQKARRRGVVVKICGIVQREHAVLAGELGADMVGVVFATSRRQVSVEVAAGIRAAIDASGARRKPLLVGVFVNEAIERALSVARATGLDVVQLSGDESPEYVAACSREYPVIKALRFPTGVGLRAADGEVDAYRRAIPAAGKRVRFLVDAYRPGEYGGTGAVADWRLASALSARREIILAGGLDPNNVKSAIAAVSPWGVDVSSGVEAGGAKDAGLIRAFLQAAKVNRSGRK